MSPVSILHLICTCRIRFFILFLFGIWREKVIGLKTIHKWICEDYENNG